ncbi:2-hydroxyacid dehydrogenase [Paenibacillus terrigena]|uniref:2-hydroxyacid dehydrogenase n=1 Tax=Paenibacillus terrigena TaxID=369333 RepID=UPI00036CBD55|nr:D-glycerate dehydrogenase [Paenibacillus terrigena]
MKPNIYVARPVPSEVAQYLETHCEVRYWTGEESITKDQLVHEIGDAEGLLLSGTPVTAEVIEAAPNLRAISNIAVGYNNLRLDPIIARGILAMHTPYVLDETVADLAFALILAAGRRVTELHEWVREGKWEKGQEEELYGLDIHHTTLGIIGMGRIGEAIARRARLGFEMNVQYYNRNRKPDIEEKLGVTYAELDELLATSDYVLLMLPLTPETRGLIGAREFDLMKRTAVFVNVARGPIVDESALYDALVQRKIYAAGLDVYAQEPIDPAHPLLTLTNVVTLPHIGSATAATRLEMASLAARNLVHALQGKPDIALIPELRNV